jgi:hypothetical protein
MAMKKTSGGDSPLRQGAGKSFWTLPIFGSTVAADHYVFWKSDRVLRFFPSGGLYRRRGIVRGGARRPHTGPAQPGPGRATPACGALVAPSYSPSDLWKLPGKIRLQELVSSNSKEYFLCITSETQKQQKTGNWHSGNSLIG